MLGAIAGDIIGSIYERRPIKTKDFPLFGNHSRFTDDTVLTVATADCILNNKDYSRTYQEYGRKYPKKGYGSSFQKWIFNDKPKPYNSFGNGSAMRVSPIGFYYSALQEVLNQAEKSAIVTHNHPEAIKGAQSVASAIYLAKNGKSKSEIKNYITYTFGYNLNRSIEKLRKTYTFDVTCQGSVPESILSFLESNSFEDAIRNAISLGGDSDTMACIAGAISHAFYKEIPDEIVREVKTRLNEDFLSVLQQFEKVMVQKD